MNSTIVQLIAVCVAVIVSSFAFADTDDTVPPSWSFAVNSDGIELNVVDTLPQPPPPLYDDLRMSCGPHGYSVVLSGHNDAGLFGQRNLTGDKAKQFIDAAASDRDDKLDVSIGDTRARFDYARRNELVQRFVDACLNLDDVGKTAAKDPLHQ